MKKFLTIFLLLSFLFFGGCDQLNKLTLNVPLKVEFNPHGSNTTVTQTEYFCLSQYQEWRDNQENIESAKYLAASYWTLSSTPNLRGDLQFSLQNASGATIFTINLGNVNMADYIGNPFKLELTATQIQAFDNVLSNLANQDLCFQGTLTVTNITGTTNASGEFNLVGKVEIVLETEVKN